MFRQPALITAVVLLTSIQIHAQSSALRTAVPAPTAASLGQYGDLDVNLYTGKPNINIPIYEARSRDLSVAISLSYNASGIKVEERASWVGLGWALHTGGVITRTLRGLPDELNGKGYYYTGDLLAGDNWLDPRQTYLDSVDLEYLDSMPNLFFFSFAGRSGQFMLGPDDVIRASPYQKLRIVPTMSGNDISKWEVQTEDGTRYVFEDEEESTDTALVSGYTPESSPTKTFFSSWYLSKIYSVAGNDSITFKYNNPEFEADHDQRTYVEYRYPIPDIGEINPSTVDSIVVANNNDLDVIYLDSLITANAKIKFVRSTRDDLTNEYKLDTLRVIVNNQTIREFVFKYGYFISGTEKRLRLDSLVEFNAEADSLPSYTFDYLTSPNLPKMDSNGMDFWGYYNGKVGNSTLVPSYETADVYLANADRRPDSSSVLAGMLKKITYPTGGYTEFSFEPHEYSWIGTSPATKVLTGWGTPYHHQVGTVAFGNKDSTGFRIDTNEDSVRVCMTIKLNQQAVQPDPPANPYMGKVILRNDDNTWSKSWARDSVTTILATFNVAPDSFLLIAESNSDAAQENYSSAYGSIDYELEEPADLRIAGGVRIKKILSHDGFESANDVVREYDYMKDDTLSSGVLVSDLRFAGEAEVDGVDYLTLSAATKIPVGITHGNHIGYRKVTVSLGENGKYGKSVHRFRSAKEAPDENFDFSDFEFGGQTDQDWQRGQLISSIDYDSAGVIRRKIYKTYVFKQDSATAATRRYRALAVKFTGLKETNPPNNKIFDVNAFELISGWTYQDTDTVFVYNSAGNDSVSTVREILYEDSTHAQVTRTTEMNSEGTKRLADFTYAQEVFEDMNDDDVHMFSQRYSTKLSEVDGSDTTDVSMDWTTWAETDGYWRPYRQWVWRSQSGVAPDDTTTTERDTLFVVNTFVDYDDYGNPAEVEDANGVKTALTYKLNNSAIGSVIKGSNTTLADTTAYDYNDTTLVLTKITDSNDIETTFEYDDFQRLIQTHHRDSLVSEIDYFFSRQSTAADTFKVDEPNFVREKLLRAAGDTTFTTNYMDGLGRTVQTQIRKDATYDIVQHTGYDERGLAQRVYKPFQSDTDHAYLDKSDFPADTLSQLTEYEASALNRVSRTVPFGGGTSNDITVAYGTEPFAGAEYRFEQITDENEVKRKEYFDRLDRRIAIVEAEDTSDSTKTFFAYDIQGNLLYSVAPEEDTTSYAYNSLSQLIEKESPDIGSVEYLYDRNGNLRFQQDAVQGTTEFTYFKYDSLNRVSVEGEYTTGSAFTQANADDVSWPTSTGSTWKIRYYYDADSTQSATNYVKGRLSMFEVNTDGDSDPEIKIRYRYDEFGNVIEKHDTIHGLSEKITRFEYDRQGNLVKTTYPGGTIVERTYNRQNQLDRVTAQ